MQGTSPIASARTTGTERRLGTGYQVSSPCRFFHINRTRRFGKFRRDRSPEIRVWGSIIALSGYSTGSTESKYLIHNVGRPWNLAPSRSSVMYRSDGLPSFSLPSAM